MADEYINQLEEENQNLRCYITKVWDLFDKVKEDAEKNPSRGLPAKFEYFNRDGSGQVKIINHKDWAKIIDEVNLIDVYYTNIQKLLKDKTEWMAND